MKLIAAVDTGTQDSRQNIKHTYSQLGEKKRERKKKAAPCRRGEWSSGRKKSCFLYVGSATDPVLSQIHRKHSNQLFRSRELSVQSITSLSDNCIMNQTKPKMPSNKAHKNLSCFGPSVRCYLPHHYPANWPLSALILLQLVSFAPEGRGGQGW